MLGASFDSVAANQKFAENNAFPFPLLCDTTRAMGVAYGAATADASGGAARIGVILDATGTVLWAGKASASTFPQEAIERVT